MYIGAIAHAKTDVAKWTTISPSMASRIGSFLCVLELTVSYQYYIVINNSDEILHAVSH